MNKSLITNLVAISIIIIGFVLKDNYSFILMTGIFAFSGSITNWLAVHMLFEKVPFLYGSGVILDRFEDIKIGIKKLILDELFSPEQINKFLLESKDKFSDKLICLLYTSPNPRDVEEARMPSSAWKKKKKKGGKYIKNGA